MTIRNLAAILLTCGLSILPACDKAAPAPASAGGAAANVGENPTSLPGRSVKTGKDAVRAATAAQDAAVGTAQEISGEAEALTIAGLAWSAPTTWQKVTPSSTMRAAEYKVASAAGHGEASVAFFANVGGDATSNIDRWRSQFSAAGGDAPEADISKRQVAGCKVTLVTIKGMMKGGQPGGPAADSPEYGLRGAIIEGPKGPIFIKFMGPDATLTESEGAWSTMVNGMRKQ